MPFLAGGSLRPLRLKPPVVRAGLFTKSNAHTGATYPTQSCGNATQGNFGLLLSSSFFVVVKSNAHTGATYPTQSCGNAAQGNFGLLLSLSFFFKRAMRTLAPHTPSSPVDMQHKGTLVFYCLCHIVFKKSNVHTGATHPKQPCGNATQGNFGLLLALSFFLKSNAHTGATYPKKSCGNATQGNFGL